MNLNRRDFLMGAATALTVAASAPLTSASAMAIGPINRARPSRLRLSIAAYSYRDYLTGKKKPAMDMFRFAELAADLGVDAIEPTSYYFPTDVDDAYLAKFKRHAFVLGLDISGTAIGNNFCLPAGPKRDEQLQLARTWIDRSAAMGAPVIRVFAGNAPKGDGDDLAFERTVAGMKESLEYAAKKGVVLALENHGGITASADGLLKLVQAIDSPYFGVNLDTGNFHSEDPYADIARLAPYALNVQVKTELRRKGSANPKEEADFSKIIGILRDAKYSGYVALEYEAAEDPLTAIPGHIKALKALLA